MKGCEMKEVGLGMERRIKQRKRRRRKEILRFMKAEWEKAKKEIMCHLFRILFSLFHFFLSKTLKNLKGNLRTSQLSAFPPFLFKGSQEMLGSTPVWSQHMSGKFWKLSESTFAVAVKVTTCILVTLPTRNQVINFLQLFHDLTLLPWPVHQRRGSAGARGLCSGANIYAGVIDSVLSARVAAGVHLTPYVTEMNVFQVHACVYIPLNSCANWKASAATSLLHVVLSVTLNTGRN